MTSSVAAAAPEMKLRDQPKSCISSGITSPSVARAENEIASARKPKPTTSQRRKGEGERAGAMICPRMIR